MDIVTWCKVPRYLHSNFPLGNPLGPPYDTATHRNTLTLALQLATDARAPQVVTSPAIWLSDTDWQNNYSHVDDSNRAELAALGEENRRVRAENNAKGLRR